MQIQNAILTGSTTVYGPITFVSGTLAGSASYAATSSYADTFTVAGRLTAQTLVVQTITSSVSFITGSTRFGSLLTNTHDFTGSVRITGSLTVNTTGTEFQVTNNGVVIGNLLTDNHSITGSVSVTGSAVISNTLTANGIMSLGDDATYGSTYKTLGLTGNANGSHRIFAGLNDDLFIGSATSRGISFWTNGTTISARIMSSGWVGLGTSSPASRLTLNAFSGIRYAYINGQSGIVNQDDSITVGGTIAAGAAVGGLNLTNNSYAGAFSPLITFSSLSPNSGYNNAYAAIYGVVTGPGPDSNWVAGGIVFSTTSTAAVGVVEKMRITSTGNVLIGTTTDAGVKLQVNGTGTFSTYVEATAGLISSNGPLYVSAGSGLNYSSRLSTAYNSPYVDTYLDSFADVSYEGRLNFRTNSGGGAMSTKMTILNNGSVGIGTTSPSALLHVSGSGSSTLMRIASAVSSNIFFVSGSGNVGIGTTTPTEKFDVIGGAVAAGNGTIRTGITYSTLGLIGTFTNHDLGVITNGTERMRITSAGFVGIGTTSPDAIFHVARSNSGGLGGQIVIDNTAGSTLNNAVEISFLTDAGATGAGTRNARIVAQNENAGNGAANMQFWTWNGSTDAERMRITSGGNVGIGTTSPSNLLSIVQANSAASTTLDITNSSNASTTTKTAQLLFSISDTANTLKPAASIVSLPDGVNVLSAGMYFSTRASDGGPFERMRITSGGNVGIGVTSPGSKLEVSGSIKFFGGGAFGANAVAISSLNVDYLLVASAYNGIVVIRDNTTGGTGCYLIDPNAGTATISSNVNGTLVFTYSAGSWYIKKTSGTVTTNYTWAFLGA